MKSYKVLIFLFSIYTFVFFESVIIAQDYFCPGSTVTYRLTKSGDTHPECGGPDCIPSGGRVESFTNGQSVTITWFESSTSGSFEVVEYYGFQGCHGQGTVEERSFSASYINSLSISAPTTIGFRDEITLTANASGRNTSNYSDSYRWGLFEGTQLIHAFDERSNRLTCTPSDYYSSYGDPKELIFEVSVQACGDPDPATTRTRHMHIVTKSRQTHSSGAMDRYKYILQFLQTTKFQ